MNHTKQELIDAILLMADKCGIKLSMEWLIKDGEPIPEIIRMVVYHMFLNEYVPNGEKQDDLFRAYGIILEYSKELRKNGLVIFKN